VPEFYFLDEGWDRVSVEDHDIARQMIALVASKFTRFLYITHVQPLADAADIPLRVEAENGTSRLVG
jgi:DNA repair exonuclease SbcCD ATPase subunit